MTNIIPMFYFPLKILFVDDNVDLLSSYQYIDIPNEIDTESNSLVAYDKLLNNSIKKADIFTEITDIIDLDTKAKSDDSVLKFSFENLFDFILSNNKGYGIAIIDCQMPLMNGIELCDKLNGHINIIKILLTGELKPIDALYAINNGKADHYIPKATPTTLDDLILAIQQLQKKYFIALTKSYLDIFKEKFSFLIDNEFSILFNQLILQYDIVEYYLISNHSVFILKDNNSLFYMFHCYTGKDLDLFCEINNYIDPNILSDMKRRKVIPDLKISYESDINKLIYPALNYGKYYYNINKIDDIKKIKGE